MSHKTQKDWLIAGMGIIVESGANELTIDRLCQVLGVTKGSFYHHFKNQYDFVEKLLVFWQDMDTRQIIEGIPLNNQFTNPVDGLINVLAGRSAESAHFEIAIRAWGLQDVKVRTYVEQIDGKRLLLLVDMFQKMGRDSARAELMAQILYTMLVGCYSIIPPIQIETLLLLYAEFKRAYQID
jgi:AcrR family transcriptional regulator